jgi:hypothetical protein
MQLGFSMVTTLENGGEETLEFPGGLKVRNVASFLEKDLPNLPRRDQERHYVSYVHGDLHGGNILMDPNENVSSVILQKLTSKDMAH